MQIQHQPTVTDQMRLRSSALEAAWNRVMKKKFLISDIKEEFHVWVTIFIAIGGVVLVSVFHYMPIQ